jgi:KDO2-lipid IV(A) lauroyltransferase
VLYYPVMEKRLKVAPDWLYFFGLLPAFALLPSQLGYRLVRTLGNQVAKVQETSRRHMIQNLNSVLPPERTEEVPLIAKRFFQVLTSEDLEGFYFPFWTKSNIDRFFTFEGLEHLQEALNSGRGALLLTGHIGCVCSALTALGLKGFPITHVARDYVNDSSIPSAFRAYGLRKIRWMESKMGRPVIRATSDDRLRSLSSASAVLQICRSLSSNQMVSMALDALPERVQETGTVMFLGRLSRFPTNTIHLAHQCRAPIIPYFAIRDRRQWSRQRIAIGPPITLTGDIQTDLQLCADRLDRVILEYPEQWFSWDSLGHFRADC